MLAQAGFAGRDGPTLLLERTGNEAVLTMGEARYSRHNWVPAFRDDKFASLQLIGETSKS
jgi:hypothetical protein